MPFDSPRQVLSGLQTPASVVMIRPSAFGYDPDTAATNSFQHAPSELPIETLHERARGEFDALVQRLRAAGVQVCDVPDRTDAATPDSVFLNNWVSFHGDGTVILYPMCAPARRRERRLDLLDIVSSRAGFRTSRVVDLSHHEHEGRYLEGTGSIVFDHAQHIAYACASPRTDVHVLRDVCDVLGYTPVVFGATDAAGQPVYHTNVVMSIGARFAVICDEAVPDLHERRALLERLGAHRDVITLTRAQMSEFAGNILEVGTDRGRPAVAMSARASSALTPDQRQQLLAHADIVESPVTWIERVGGGSVRCMLAGVPGM